MKLYKYIIYLLIITLSTSCVKEIPVESTFEPQIFIQGYLSNYPAPVELKIQETVPITDTHVNPISNAGITLFTKNEAGVVSIISNNFLENEGTYTTREDIVSLIGNSYWVEVILQNGTVFLSDIELLKPEVVVNDITKNNGFTRVEFSDPAEDTNFYLFHFLFYEQNNFIGDIWELSSDALYNGNENAYFEIDFTEGDYVYVSIQNLNFNTYQFYLNSFSQYENQIANDLDPEQPIDPTQLFLPPPASLIGNITNTTEKRRALGFFGVFSYNGKAKEF